MPSSETVELIINGKSKEIVWWKVWRVILNIVADNHKHRITIQVDVDKSKGSV